MKNLLLFVFLLSWVSATSQVFEPKWESCFGGTGMDEGRGIEFLNESYWIVSGTNSFDGDISNNHGAYDIWLLNVDTIGNLIFEKTFGGMKADGGNLDIKKLNDTLFYITGITKSDDGDISDNPWAGSNESIWVLQVDTQGEILWEKVHGGSKIDWMSDMEVTSDGGVLCLCLTTSDDGDISSHNGAWDLWLFKLNSNGDLLWEMSLGGEGSESSGGIMQTSDNGYLVVGDTDGYGGGNYDTTCNYHGVPGGWTDAWVIKLDSLRNIEWQQCYGGSYHEWASDIIELEDSYIILGATESNDGDVIGFHGNIDDPYSGSDIWVFKIDKQGNLIWQRCLGGSYHEWARNIFPTSDGGIMVIGSTASDDGDVEGYNGLDIGLYDDVWFAKLDYMGNLEWQYCYGGGGRELIYRGAFQKSDWDYLVTMSTETNEWQCFVNPQQLDPDLRVAEIYDSTVGIAEDNTERSGENLSVGIFPNPASERLNFKYTLPAGQTEAKLSIYNSAGKFVKGFNLMAMQGQVVIKTESLNPGVYFYRLVSGGFTNSGKIIISH